MSPPRTSRSGARSCARCWPTTGRALAVGYARRDDRQACRLARSRLLGRKIEQLAAQEVARRAIVQLHVVERIGEDLGRPDQTGLHILDPEEMNCPKQQSEDADC